MLMWRLRQVAMPSSMSSKAAPEAEGLLEDRLIAVEHDEEALRAAAGESRRSGEPVHEDACFQKPRCLLRPSPTV
jgi:hypothetical protein